MPIADEELDTEIGPDTAAYLVELAEASYKRQADLDESIWRSLPFFAATFAFIATIIGQSSSKVPEWGSSVYSYASGALFLSAVLCLAWSLRWFWAMLSPRAYEFPAPDAAVHDYALALRLFYSDEKRSDAGSAPTDPDKRVVHDLRLLMAQQYGAGAATNLTHNAVRLEARSKVLLFMLLSFALAFACQAIIFVGERIGNAHETGRHDAGTEAESVAGGGKSRLRGAPGPSQSSTGDQGGDLLGTELQGARPAEEMKSKPTSSAPGKPVAVTRPVPPTMQAVMKSTDTRDGKLATQKTAEPSETTQR